MKVKINGEDAFRITSKFGDQESFRKSPHKGIDLAIPEGTDLLSPVKGYVSEVFNYHSQNAGLGLKVKMQNGQELIFGHMSKISVNKGDIISVGERLGLSGSTGETTGAHLHIGLKENGQFLDPTLYERAFQKVYIMVQKGQMVASDIATQKPHLYNAISDTLQSLLN